jgi:two-component system response regulator RegA
MATREKQAALIIDDDEVFRQRLCRAFLLRGWEAYEAGNAAAALAAAREFGPDLAVVDLRLPGESGMDIVRELRAVDATISIIMLTGYGSIATAVEAVRLGATNYLAKPADADDVLAAFARGDAPPLEPPPATYEAPSLARAEWEHINRVLSDCGGNVSEAARRLRIHRRSLQRKLQKYPPST